MDPGVAYRYNKTAETPRNSPQAAAELIKIEMTQEKIKTERSHDHMKERQDVHCGKIMSKQYPAQSGCDIIRQIKSMRLYTCRDSQILVKIEQREFTADHSLEIIYQQREEEDTVVILEKVIRVS
jgi:hypothetical protein